MKTERMSLNNADILSRFIIATKKQWVLLLIPQNGNRRGRIYSSDVQDEGFLASKRSRSLVETCHLETLNSTTDSKMKQ